MDKISQILIACQIKIEKNSGKEIQIHCPFPDHPDKNASASINRITGNWYCHGCGRGGPLEYLVKISTGKKLEINEIVSSEDEALINFNSMYEKSLDVILSYDNDIEFQEIMEYELSFFKKAWKSKRALKYLLGRKLSIQSIKKFNLMYASEGNYANRIIIPFYRDKKLIGFNSRTILPNEKLRYMFFLNQNKFHDYLYNYENLNFEKPVIIIEGGLDLIYMHSLGFNNVTSTLSTRLDYKHIEALIDVDKLILCYDNDIKSKAGQKALLKNARKILQNTNSIQVLAALLPDGKDPNELSKKELIKVFSKIKKIKLSK